MRSLTHIQHKTAWFGLSERRCTESSRDLRPQGVQRSDGVGGGGWGHHLGDRGWGGGGGIGWGMVVGDRPGGDED